VFGTRSVDDSIMRLGPGRRLVVSSLAACGLLLLGATGSSSAAEAQGTLTVTLAGAGSGWITGVVVNGSASRLVISCGTICSARLPLGTDVQLTAQSADNSTFANWSGSCEADSHGGIGGNSCQALLEGDTVVQATFNLMTPPCIVPGLRGRTLATAKHLLRSRNCKLGSIAHAFSSRVKKGRVISQNPKAHWQLANGAVDLVLSKGER
jgi:hypothetical protein